MKRVFSRILPSVGALALLAAAPAQAQDAAAAASDESDEIVVTGTSIRGVAPAGAAAVNLGEEAITATQSTSTVELLTNIPQIGGFNTLQAVAAVGPQQTANRPAVHGLTSGTSGGSPTLILMDGRRLAGAGVVQTVPDPDVVPPGALERVEVLTDGGSSVYGADAVGGVINLITRKDFDGLEFNVREGTGDLYQSTDAYATIGRKYDTGSIFLTYNYSHHDPIYGRDRDYVRNLVYDQSSPFVGFPLNRSCATGNVVAAQQNPSGSYAVQSDGQPGGAAVDPTTLTCDLTDNTTFYPEERRDSVFLGWSQDLNDVLTFDLRAWYTVRQSDNDVGPAFSNTNGPSQYITSGPTGTVTLANGTKVTASHNNFFHAANSETVQQVFFDYSAIPGLNTDAHVEYETYGISPELTLDLGHDWQARGFLNYGHAVTSSFNPHINPNVVNANIADINFYDLSATDSAILQQMLAGAEEVGRGEDEIVNGRLTFDGPLLTLPAGQVRGAFGIEYLGENFNNYNTQVNPRDTSDTRRSHAFFAEVNVPVVSPEQNIPFISALNVNLSARRDSYSDFDSVTTPRYGFTYQPVDWLTFRGNWGKSFQAPSLADTATAGQAAPTIFPSGALGAFLPDGFTNADGKHDIMALFGSVTLKPQQAETWSAGFDISPPVVPGLTFGLTHWSVDYSDQVNSPPTPNQEFWSDDATWCPSGDPADASCIRFTTGGAVLTPAQIYAFAANHDSSQAAVDLALANSNVNINQVNIIVDNRRRNLAAHRLAGWDAYARYSHDTGFGSIYASANATFTATDKLNGSGLGFGPNTAALERSPRWGATGTFGATVGDDFRAQATVNYTPTYNLIPTSANNQQNQIDAVYPIDLYGEYSGFGNNLTLSAGVNNVFDQDPAHLNGINQLTYGYVGGNLGRVFYIGLDKKF